MFNYNNPYLNTYNGYYPQPYNNVQMPNNNLNNNYQTQAQQNTNNVPNQQTTYMPLTFVNNIDEVNKIIVNPNTSIYLRDNNSNKLFIKSCDSTGKYTLKTYELVEINENTQKKANEQQKDITKDFISKDDLKAIEEKFDGKLSKLQSKIDKLAAKKIIQEE